MRFEQLRVHSEEGGRIALLEFDHGKANEMGSVELAEIEQLCAWLESDGGPLALVSFSQRRSRRGTPIFVAGANVTERYDWDDTRVKKHVRWQRQVLARLRQAPVFHVAVVGGVALGWGTEFLLTADYRLAADGASFGLPETGLGILPGAGGTSELWAHVGPAQALRLGMTGERIGAAEAHRIGLVQEVLEDVDSALVRARTLAGMAATRSPTALRAFKRALLRSIGVEPQARTEIEALAYEACVDSGDAAIGRASFTAIQAGTMPTWGPRR